NLSPLPSSSPPYLLSSYLLLFSFYSSPHPPDLHSFPTRRSSDLDPLQQRRRAPAHVAQVRRLRPEVVRAGVPLHRHAHVLEHGEMREHVRDLVRLGHAQAGHLVLGQPGDVAAVEPDAAARRPHLARDQAEKRCLARTIRADDRAELAAADADVDAIDGEEAAERTREL